MVFYDEAIDYRLVSYSQLWSFTPIWKNATASIFESFSKNYPGIYRSESNHQIHSFIYSIPESKDLKMLHKNSKEYQEFVEKSYNFVCLRDPYRRFISNFYHKIVLNPNGVEAQDFFKNYNAKQLDPINKLKIFLKYMESSEKLDPHFFSQSRIADYGYVDYSYCINLENINKDWKVLAEKFNNIPKLLEQKLQASDSDYFAKMIATDQRFKGIYHKIKMLYLDDYKFLESFG
jgi:hypothetical protein